MKTQVLKLSDIKAAAYNPRKQLKPGDADYERLKNSITNFGLVEPVIVNQRNMTLVGGHQRYTILKDLGETETEAIIVDLDEEGEKTLNIALNKIEGGWDNEKLRDILSELPTEEVEKTSFSKDEIDDLLKDLGGAQEAMDAQIEQETEKGDKETPPETSQEGQETPSKGFEIYLSFTTQEAAEEWLRAHNVETTFSDNRSIVITMGEAGANAVG